MRNLDATAQFDPAAGALQRLARKTQDAFVVVDDEHEGCG
jgi:hypothetical protein